MGTSVLKAINEYEKETYNNGVKKIIDIFTKMKNEVVKSLINNSIIGISSNLKKNKQYENMMNGITSFQKEIQDKKDGGKIGGYALNTDYSADKFDPGTADKKELEKKLAEAKKEKTAKESYYKKWLGTEQASSTSLLKLTELYNYDGDSQLKLSNVLKDKKVTANLYTNKDESTDKTYLVLKVSEDAEQEVYVTLTGTDVKFNFKKEQNYIDDILNGANQVFEKFKNYKNYCDGIWAVLNSELYGTDDNSQNSFARKVDDFFGQGRYHNNNKKVLNVVNTNERELASQSGDFFKEKELVDYYYKEDDDKFFSKLSNDDMDYEKNLDNRKNFIKSFYEDFESGGGANVFSMKEKMEEISKQDLENDTINNQIQNQGGVSVELQDIKVTKVKIEWKTIFPKEIKDDEFPWTEEWEQTKSIIVDGKEIKYPVAFDKFNNDFNDAVIWLLVDLGDNIKKLETNIQTLEGMISSKS